MKQIYLEIIRELRGCGYRAKGEVMNAMYYGVPQARERVIIIGVREDLGREPSHPRPTSRPVPCGTIRVVAEPRLENSERVSDLWKRIAIGQNASDIPDQNGNGFGLQKVDPKKPCPTVLKGWTAGTGLLHWSEPRFLSIPELTQIASFPSTYTFPGEPVEAINRIGNSVPPLLMKAIATHIKEHLLP